MPDWIATYSGGIIWVDEKYNEPIGCNVIRMDREYLIIEAAKAMWLADGGGDSFADWERFRARDDYIKMARAAFLVFSREMTVLEARRNAVDPPMEAIASMREMKQE